MVSAVSALLAPGNAIISGGVGGRGAGPSVGGRMGAGLIGGLSTGRGLGHRSSGNVGPLKGSPQRPAAFSAAVTSGGLVGGGLGSSPVQVAAGVGLRAVQRTMANAGRSKLLAQVCASDQIV